MPAKVVHHWNKDLADVEFFVDYHGAKAVVQWVKRNEMLIHKGATISTDMPTLKDGSMGFNGKMTLAIRQLHAYAISGDKTTKDVVLKSVNEVGLFLYYGGTNGWLVLKDKSGKTIDEYSR